MKKFEKGIVIIDNVTIGVEKMKEESQDSIPYPSVRVTLTSSYANISLTYEDANLLLEKIKNKETVIIGLNTEGNYDELLNDYKFQPIVNKNDLKQFK